MALVLVVGGELKLVALFDGGEEVLAALIVELCKLSEAKALNRHHFK